MNNKLKVLGGQESYFTGKLESYLRSKGLPYENTPFTMEELQKTCDITGFFQIPQVNCADNSWLVDTTLIIAYLDRQHPEPKTVAVDPAANFISLLLEDYADEWMWRPAMHYRWSFPNSTELLSSWLAEHSPETDVSMADKKAGWTERQQSIFVQGDGVTEKNRATVEASYLDALAALEIIFKQRDFILGDRPTQADFGFMGPMFRHFFCDPDPARIMRDTAPAVHEWVARMWNMSPQRFSAAAPITTIADDLEALLEPITTIYLPYLVENEKAVLNKQTECSYQVQGADFTEPTKPFRQWCLDELRRHYQDLDSAAKKRVEAQLGQSAITILATPPSGNSDHLMPTMPIPAGVTRSRDEDSWGRPITA
jgi:glutathione S-transferase